MVGIIDVPESAVPGTVRGTLRLFRGASDQAVDGLEGMLREPHGCFEQTSSTTYPNLLVLQLLKAAEREGHPTVLRDPPVLLIEMLDVLGLCGQVPVQFTTT